MSKTKDPAVLWYVNDWTGGTRLMSFSHMGAYMELLMGQFQYGHLSMENIRHLLRDDMTLWETGLKEKFIKDANGLYYNEKMDQAINERLAYKQNRLENLNGHKRPHMDAPYAPPECGDGDGNVNIDTIEYKLSEYLYSLIKNRNPKHREPDLRAWAKHIDLMTRIDKRDPDEIKRVISWCQNDTFWQNNILSTEKLRKQYDQLYLKMNKAEPKPKICEG